MKTVMLTEEEIKLILEDIMTTLQYYEVTILSDYNSPNLETNSVEEREDLINQAMTASSIIKKLRR